ncbi:MAG: flagellar biosynthetic protein FliO [Lacipirellulaceae bacterium]
MPSKVPSTISYRRLTLTSALLTLLVTVVIVSSSALASQTLISYQRDQAPATEAPRFRPETDSSPPERFAANRFDTRQSNFPPAEVVRGNLPSKEPRVAAAADPRKLAPSSATDGTINGAAAKTKSPLGLPVSQLFSTAGAGLAIVVGLFLVCAWLWRGGKHNPNAALPQAAFQVLGRAPLVGRTTAQLIQVGNKLVLVAVTADGLQPLTEITDAAEVDRLAGLCMGDKQTSSTAEFQKILRKLAQEPATGFLGAEAA